ncbi:CotH protein [Rubripirellula obstinata]|uniref:CotH protein n=1 Tax=Rubripirellula obstinata TaxID=406547 RepID=A0A5B1CP66_9BACT|nr:lamin tail domain-containing protein [Rubripirellula obstinata]KAA1261400.1 CotH protein [Rubripirellula obstinata]
MPRSRKTKSRLNRLESLEKRQLLAADFLITEFVASNGSSLLDAYSRSSDWIEIRNVGSTAGDLQGWSLTDDPDELDQWTFPDTPESELAAGDFLVVFASGDGVPEPSTGELHTNFRLSAGGEYLALVQPGGQVANEFGSATSDYPDQQRDISFGIDSSGNTNRYFVTPTPRTANGIGVEGFVEDTTFSLDRGFYTSPIVVDVTSATEGATLVYTTDGSEPTLSNGTAVFVGANTAPTASVPINTTTVLRAAAFKNGLLETNVDTQSYFYLNDVVDQPSAPAGFPTTGLPRFIDYEIDPEIAGPGNPTGRADVLAALESLPTLSLTSDVDNIFGPAGIYSNPQDDTIEVATSVEWILADGESGFQVDAGLKIAGGASRNPSASAKHSMSLRFRSIYGASRLDYPLFADSPVTEFNSLQLRAMYNNSWIHRDSNQRDRGTLIRDQFIRDSMIAMGNDDGGRGSYANLYLNGLYWGVYNVHERADASHYAEYHGGDDDRIDALNGGSPVDGTIASFNALKAAAAAGNWTEVTNRLDVDNFIDWTIINAYGGNDDLKFNGNWRAAGGGLDGAKWRMYSWDSERTLEGVNAKLPGTITDATRMLADLSDIPEFIVRFGDRLHLHFSEGGALTPSATETRWNARVAELEDAIVAESARWGDNRESQPYTKGGHWTPEIDRLINTYFPARSGIVLDAYENLGFFPSIDAPQTLINSNVQAGGAAAAGSELTFAAEAGEIYYTTDGSDPRLPGGGVSPNAIKFNGIAGQRTLIDDGESWKYDDTGTDLGTAWRSSSFNDSGWSEGDAELGYGESDEATEISYGSNQQDKHPTSYFRKTFTLSNDFDALTLQLKVDDGAVVYLNGVEADRINMPSGAISYSTSASGPAGNDGNSFINIPLNPNLLVVGNNVLAIEVHQIRSVVNGQRTGPVTSSDLSFDARLLGVASAFQSDPIVLNQSVQIRTRARDAGAQWSALQSSDFVVAGEPADATNFRITEINYNDGGDDVEDFIEVMNVSATESIALSGLSLSDAVRFDFGDTVLAPGQRAVVVEDADGFSARYAGSGSGPILVLGVWEGALNNSGEEIEVIDSANNVIMSVDYRDSDPWPFAADGNGGTLSLTDPLNTPAAELDKPYRWTASGVFGGTPGSASVAPRGIVVNEILAHTDPPQSDSIELRNSSDQPINISGWWLSDSSENLLKYRIPTMPALQPGALVVFDAGDFNLDPALPGQVSFGLNAAEGDQVYLSQASGGVVTRIEDAVEFGATFNGVSLGRTPDGSRLVPLHQPSLGMTNGAFAFSDVVISEIQYHPDAADEDNLEFIEVTNWTDGTIDLSNWRLRGEGDFNFAEGQSIAAGQSLVIVPFEPSNTSDVTAFNNHYGITGGGVTLLGPFTGSLSNSNGLVKLQSPDDPPMDDPMIQPNVNVDELVYDDLAPWPVSADGSGNSLNRIGPSTLGAFAGSWQAAAPTPGSVNSAPNVDSIEINAGRPTRSEVTSITVNFDSIVTLDASNFELTNTRTNEIVSGLLVDTDNGGGKTTATLTFTAGDSVINGIDSDLASTLADGTYELRYRFDGFGNTANRVDSFFRDYGDADGDGTVGLTDFAAFRSVFGQEDLVGGLDADRDGEVSLTDFAAFRSAFGN